MRFILSLASCLLAGACTTVAPPSNGGGNPAVVEGDRHVGALVVEQTMAADKVADENRRKAKFMALWECLKADRCVGVDGEEVTLFLRYNRQRIWEQKVLLRKGVAKTTVPGSMIRSDTGLCVEVPVSWGAIARQEAIPVGETRAVCTGDIYPYFSSGRGLTARDAYGVSAIKPRSIPSKKQGAPTS